MSYYRNGKLRKRELQCEGKRGYRSKKVAKTSGRRAEQHVHSRLSVYRCPHCDLFHLGHKA